MKRLWISSAVLLLIGLLSAGHLALLSSITEHLTQLLTRAEREVLAENWATAESLTRQALEDWESYDFYLHATLHHKDTDSILVGFHQALAFLEGSEQQPSEYAAVNAQLITELRLLMEEEIPTPQNIL